MDSKRRKKRQDKYEKKIAIKGDLDSVLKVLVNSPPTFLRKRKGNKKVKRRRK